MELKIDFHSGPPIYIQIVEQVRMLVENGNLKEGDQLPTVRQLAADLRVNFNTVARAYRLLDEAGLISTQHGRGTYVWNAPTEESANALRNHNLSERVENCFQELIRLGYQPLEIQTAMHHFFLSQKERNE